MLKLNNIVSLDTCYTQDPTINHMEDIKFNKFRITEITRIGEMSKNYFECKIVSLIDDSTSRVVNSACLSLVEDTIEKPKPITLKELYGR